MLNDKNAKLTAELLDLIEYLKEHEGDAKNRLNIEGETAFMFSRIALEETLKRNGVNIGRLIDIA